MTVSSTAESADNSIAVLPFVAMSSGEDDGYFADGLTEELLNSLSQLSDLKVAGRTSSFYYKDKTPSFREVGEALGVAHVLEGSVRRAGNRLRITAQLIAVDDGYHLWSATYDRSMDDIFAIQERYRQPGHWCTEGNAPRRGGRGAGELRYGQCRGPKPVSHRQGAAQARRVTC